MTRNIVITGGNDGIGRAMARELAASGDRVVIASRDLARSEAVADGINAHTPAARVKAMPLNLGDFDAIDRFADRVMSSMAVIDVLILNAGLLARGGRRLDNGFEAMIGVMHFGHFRLAQRLLEAVIAAPQGRIVVTSSTLHERGAIDEASFTDPGRHRTAIARYAQAKLANLLFTRELARRLADTRVTVNAFHPGAVTTGIWQEMPRPVRALLRCVLTTPERGADTGVWLARSPEAGGYSGEYFVRRCRASGSAKSRDAESAGRLWRYSELAAGPSVNACSIGTR